MKLLGEIVEHEGALAVRIAGAPLWYPLEGASGLASDFRETFNAPARHDIGKRLWRASYGLCMESAEQRDARKAG